MDLTLFLVSTWYYDWPLIIGGLMAIAAIIILQRDVSTQKKRRLVHRKLGLTLLILGVLCMAFYPVMNHIRTVRERAQNKAYSLRLFDSSPFTIYSLGDKPVPSLTLHGRTIEQTTIGGPSRVYFWEEYQSDSNLVQDDTYYGRVDLLAYATTPSDAGDQQCRLDSVIENNTPLQSPGYSSSVCRLLDPNQGNPIYGYGSVDDMGTMHADAILASYAGTRVGLRFVGNNGLLTLEQQLKLFKMIHKANPQNLTYVPLL